MSPSDKAPDLRSYHGRLKQPGPDDRARVEDD